MLTKEVAYPVVGVGLMGASSPSPFSEKEKGN